MNHSTFASSSILLKYSQLLSKVANLRFSRRYVSHYCTDSRTSKEVKELVKVDVCAHPNKSDESARGHFKQKDKFSADNMVKILNVAEKNDASKNIANILSRGGSARRDGYSQWNKIYEFPYQLQGQDVQMVFTSVSGHLLNYEFVGSYKRWHACAPLELFSAPVVKGVKEENMNNIKRTLEREVRGASKLIIWTDCDREGENIGFEIIDVCRAVKPNITVLRARFSEITQPSVTRAINNLVQPDELQNKAVDVRSELDLRIGAAFTRFQTLRLQKVFPGSLSDTLISYGSCQFPTLGFVVQRYKAIQEFQQEQFWKIKATHRTDEGSVDFSWLRVRLFDETCVDVLLDTCLDDPTATVTSVNARPKSKWRPLPLDTIEFEKLSSRKLKISAKEAMKIAEKLYTSGLISYPRTETNIFPKDLDLVPLVEIQTQSNVWGGFAAGVLERGPNPRRGKKTDEAHPPIHPTKLAPNLDGNEKRIYELIVRSFLACVSDDARGYETVVEIQVAGEKFRASGLIILEKNYLEVYPYDKWTDKPMPHYEMNAQFTPELEKVDGMTTAPPLLTEADLIALMEKHGIGTDATHADHIETIKSRLYVGLLDSRFVPGTLGMGLVNGYDAMGFQMSEPHLRAGLEKDLKDICAGRKDAAVVLQEQVQKYREVFEEATRQADKLDAALAITLEEAPAVVANEAVNNIVQTVGKCGSCGDRVAVKQKKNSTGLYISCQGFPDCRVCIWFPADVMSVTVLPEKCQQCAGNPNLLELEFRARSYSPILADRVTTCVYGCDNTVLDCLEIRPLPRVTPGQPPPAANNARGGPANARGRGANNARGAGNNARGAGNNARGAGNNARGAGNNARGAGNNARGAGNNARGAGNLMMVGANRGGANNNRGGASNTRGGTNNTRGGTSNTRGGASNARGGTRRGAIHGGVANAAVHNAGGSNNATEDWGDDGDIDFDDLDFGDDGFNEAEYEASSGTYNNNNIRNNNLNNRGRGGTNNSFSNSSSSSRGSSSSSRGGSSSQAGSSSNSSGYSSQSQNSTQQNKRGGVTGRRPIGLPEDESEDDPGNRIMCNCGDDAVQRTVRKEGPNTGRLFYACPKPMGDGCGFFLWADDGPSTEGGGGDGGRGGGASGGGRGGGGGSSRGGFSQGSSNWGSSGTRADCDVMCACEAPAVQRTVQKEGPNKGRDFFVCSKMIGEQCSFFKWADEIADAGGGRGGGGSGNYNNTGRGGRGSRGRGSKRGGASTSSGRGGGAPRKRKCGICGEEGHTKTKCPMNNY